MLGLEGKPDAATIKFLNDIIDGDEFPDDEEQKA